MRNLKKENSAETNNAQAIQLKKSMSTKIENNKTSGSSKGGEFQSQNSEASLPDSARVRRDGRKRMKKNFSNKVYENMQSQDVSKVDDSNLQQINIDTSMNKDSHNQYQTIDFMSLNGLSEQTMHNQETQPAQTFVGGAFKQQTAATTAVVNYQTTGYGVQKNSSLSIQQQLDQQNQTQNQGISQFYAQADGAQMPKRMDNRNRQVIDLSQNQELAVQKISFKQKACRFILGLIFFGYLSFNIYMTFQQSSVESGQLRGRGNEGEGSSENGDEYYPHAREELKKDLEDIKMYSSKIEACQLGRQQFLKLYRKKEFFFDISTCEWLRTCKTKSSNNNNNPLIYSNFCVSECPSSYREKSGTCLSEKTANATLEQCPENNFQYGNERFGSEDLNLFTCMKCMENCFSCISQNVCQICEDDYFLQNGKCVRECKTSPETTYVLDFITRSCVFSENTKIKTSTNYIYSKILSKRVYYDLIFSPEKTKIKSHIQYLYFINDRNHSTKQIQENYHSLSDKLQSFDNLIIVSLPSIPDALLRDPLYYGFFNQELIPQIENRIQVPSSPTHRMIAGEGFGGFQALYIATNSRPLFEFGFIGIINSFLTVHDIDKNEQPKIFISSLNEKVSSVTFNLRKDLNMKTYLYSDFTGLAQPSKQENSFKELVNKYNEEQEKQEVFEIIFFKPENDCQDTKRDSCYQNRYENLFEGVLKYNKKIQEVEEDKGK